MSTRDAPESPRAVRVAAEAKPGGSRGLDARRDCWWSFTSTTTQYSKVAALPLIREFITSFYGKSCYY